MILLRSALGETELGLFLFSPNPKAHQIWRINLALNTPTIETQKEISSNASPCCKPETGGTDPEYHETNNSLESNAATAIAATIKTIMNIVCIEITMRWMIP